ncbi:MAG: ABC transporter substrate-binding protein, partial [Thermodesulfobacteriota bacterium]
PSKFRIEDMIPEQLRVNNQVLTRLGDTWSLTPSLRQRMADTQRAGMDNLLPPEEGRIYRIGLNYIVPAPVFDYAIRGFREELKELGYIEGENLKLDLQHANGDMSFLPQSIAALLQKKPDLLVAMSTPSLSSAIAHADGVNIAFGIVSAPLEAGAGESFAEHLPHVTGIAQQLPTEELFDWVRRLFPHARSIGALYNPSEANSAKEIVDLERILPPRDFDLEQVAVYSTSEVPEGIRSLLNRNVDLVFAMGDNTVANGMPAIVKACRQHNIPIIAEDIALMGSGALISCAPGPYSDGRELARLSARLLNGADPASIPIRYGEKRELTVDLAALKDAGVEVPPELLKRADLFFNLKQGGESPAEIALVNLVENASLDEAIRGVEAGLQKMGLREGIDYRIKPYNAQGDMIQVSQILDQVTQERPDLLISVATPVFIAAAKREFDFPLVFTVASDPEKLGLFKDGVPPHITGIHDDPPVEEVLQMALRHVSDLDAAGIIHDPAQMNSMISVEKLRLATAKQGVTMHEAPASNVSDLPMATRALIQKGARAIILSANNLATTGFSAIYKVARAEGVPVYTTDMELVPLGAAGGIGTSYFEWGVESGIQAARVLAGVSPSQLPIKPTRSYTRIEPEGEIRDRPLELRSVLYSETEFAERCLEGYLAGLADAGLIEGEDYNLQVYNAQGDMSTLSSIMATVRADQVDLLMVVSTPTLQAALRMAGEETPIVFTGVGDGVRAGAGTSETEHRPNVTGISTRSPFKGMARLIRETLPGAHRVGTIFTPGEINSVLYKDWFEEALQEQGLELTAVPVSTSADVAQAAAQLCSRDIDVVAQVVDNLTRPGFALIARKAQEKGVPAYVFDTDQMKDGGTLCLARDYFDAGIEAAHKAVRVLKGENPAHIPFHNTRSEKLIINRALAQKYNLRLSEQLLNQAQEFADLKKGDAGGEQL